MASRPKTSDSEIMMEPRKVQKVGYSTLSVSIPMNWAKKMNVQKGDVVFISEENDGALRITPEPTKAEDNSVYVVNVDNCDNTKVLARVIVGNYVLGRNLIRVESSRRLMREQIESIREVTQRLLGIGIIEESDRHLLLQCSIDPKNFPLETVIRRLYVITSIMFKESIDALIDRDMELAKDAIAREHEADTIFWLLTRLLSSAQQSRIVSEAIGITDPIEVVEHNLIAWYLEMIGDRLDAISQNVISLEERREESDEELIEEGADINLLKNPAYVKAGSFIDNKEFNDDVIFKKSFNTISLELSSIILDFLSLILFIKKRQFCYYINIICFKFCCAHCFA